MARYGAPYRGSKSRVAGWVVENLPPAGTLVDLMAGGCAVTHAAMLSGRWGRFVVNDLSDAPWLFIDAANGRYADETRIPTREEFLAQRDSDPYIRYLFSFGNNGRDYLFSREVEPVKVAASRMLASATLAERRSWYRVFMRELAAYGRPVGDRLQAVERMEGLARLQSLQLDYRDVEIPDDSTVYCDPPYRDTNCGCYSGFDHDAFDDWLGACGRLVIVSEYTAPRGCVEVASRPRQCSASANGKGQRSVERLFVHESHLDEYNGRMASA